VPGRWWQRDDGMVTAELAACLPVLALVVLFGLAVVTAAGERVRAQDAAAEVARASARGDPAAAALLFAHTAPAGATYTVSTEAGEVTATVTVTLHPLDGRLGGYSITVQSVAAVEPP
jgi:Flp pilus assembly protein TadG